MPTTRPPPVQMAVVYRNEIEALETYQEAMGRLRAVPFPVLAAHDSHLHRVGELQRQFGDLDTRAVVNDAGFEDGWRHLAGSSDDRSLLARLARCEAETTLDYLRLCRDEELDDASRALFQAVLLPEQRLTQRTLAGVAGEQLPAESTPVPPPARSTP